MPKTTIALAGEHDEADGDKRDRYGDVEKAGDQRMRDTMEDSGTLLRPDMAPQ